MKDRLEIAKNWLPRYTGMPLDQFGDYVLLTNFHYYVNALRRRNSTAIFAAKVGRCRPPRIRDGLSIVNFGIGSANAATVMDLLSATASQGRAFSGQMRGLEDLDGNRPLHPADCRHPRRRHERRLFSAGSAGPALVQAAQVRVGKNCCRAIWSIAPGVVYTTNRRLWEHDTEFLTRLQRMTCIGIDMETATIFIVGHYNEIARGALLLGFRHAVHARRGENRRIRSRGDAELVGHSSGHWHRGDDAKLAPAARRSNISAIEFFGAPPGFAHDHDFALKLCRSYRSLRASEIKILRKKCSSVA